MFKCFGTPGGKTAHDMPDIVEGNLWPLINSVFHNASNGHDDSHDHELRKLFYSLCFRSKLKSHINKIGFFPFFQLVLLREEINAWKLHDKALVKQFREKLQLEMEKLMQYSDSVFGCCDTNKDDLITLAEFKAFILSSEAEWFTILGIKVTVPIETDGNATQAKPLTAEFIDATLTRVNETNATSLDMNGYSLKELPGEIFPKLRLQNKIETFSFDNNFLTFFPGSLAMIFSGLTSLSLASNSIRDISQMGRLVHLRHLDLSSNRIEEIASDFFALTELEDLNLSRNYIRVLPKAIGALTRLTLLDLNGNLLKTLPLELGHLVNLVEFDLGKNFVELMPDDIANMKHLEAINLYQNRLKTLPKTLGLCLQLNRVIIDGNPMDYANNDLLVSYNESFEHFKIYLVHMAADCDYVFKLPPVTVTITPEIITPRTEKNDLTVVVESSDDEKRAVNPPTTSERKKKKSKVDVRKVSDAESTAIEKPAEPVDEKVAHPSSDEGKHKHHHHTHGQHSKSKRREQEETASEQQRREAVEMESIERELALRLANSDAALSTGEKERREDRLNTARAEDEKARARVEKQERKREKRERERKEREMMEEAERLARLERERIEQEESEKAEKKRLRREASMREKERKLELERKEREENERERKELEKEREKMEQERKAEQERREREERESERSSEGHRRKVRRSQSKDREREKKEKEEELARFERERTEQWRAAMEKEEIESVRAKQEKEEKKKARREKTEKEKKDREELQLLSARAERPSEKTVEFASEIEQPARSARMVYDLHMSSGDAESNLTSSSPRKRRPLSTRPELIASSDILTPSEEEKRVADEQLAMREEEAARVRAHVAQEEQARLDAERQKEWEKEEYARRQKQRQSTHVPTMIASKEEEAEIHTLLGAYQVAQQGLGKLVELQREKRAELETQHAHVIAQTPPHMAGQIAVQLHAQKLQLFQAQQVEIKQLFALLPPHEQGHLQQYAQQQQMAFQVEQQQFLQQQQYYQQMQMQQMMQSSSGQLTPQFGSPFTNSSGRVGSLRFISSSSQPIQASGSSSSLTSLLQQPLQQTPSRSIPSTPSKLLVPSYQQHSSSAGSSTTLSMMDVEDTIDAQLKTHLWSQLVAITNFLQQPSTPDKVVVIIATTVKSIGRLEKDLKERVRIRLQSDAQLQRPVSTQLVNKDKIAQIKFLTIRAFEEMKDLVKQLMIPDPDRPEDRKIIGQFFSELFEMFKNSLIDIKIAYTEVTSFGSARTSSTSVGLQPSPAPKTKTNGAKNGHRKPCVKHDIVSTSSSSSHSSDDSTSSGSSYSSSRSNSSSYSSSDSSSDSDSSSS